MNRTKHIGLFAVIALIACAVLSACTQPASYDLILRGGTVYDGSGEAPFVGDVALDGDTILYENESYLVPSAWYRFDPTSKRSEKTALAELLYVTDMRSFSCTRLVSSSKLVGLVTRMSKKIVCMYWVLSLTALEKRSSSRPRVSKTPKASRA